MGRDDEDREGGEGSRSQMSCYINGDCAVWGDGKRRKRSGDRRGYNRESGVMFFFSSSVNREGKEGDGIAEWVMGVVL